MKNKALILPPRFTSRSFTIIELIVVIIIVGILAAVGVTQYASIVEKSRTSEAKIRIGAMRQLAYEYYLNNGSVTGITNNDLGIDDTCTSTHYYRYAFRSAGPTYIYLDAHRCIPGAGGKSPSWDYAYRYYMLYYPASGGTIWYCYPTVQCQRVGIGLPEG